MKRYTGLLVSLLAVSLVCLSCREDSPVVEPGSQEISLYIRMSVPGVGQVLTRAVDESEVTDVVVLVFEDTGSGYQYTYLVPGYTLTSSGESGYNFYARLLPTVNPVKLYLVANAPTAVNGLVAGSSETTVRQAITGTFTAAGFDATGILPMFGEIDLPDGMTDDMEESAVLVRSAARVDVVVNTDIDNFELTSVRIYRASNLYQVIPNAMVNNVVTTASTPAGTTQSVTTNPVTVNATSSIGQVYLPESPLPAVEERAEATVVVIGGRFGGSTEETFYRMDFVPDDAPELFGQVLRNHLYQFNINGVTAPGWPDPDEAAEYESSQINVEIKVWEQNTVAMVFDDVDYFGVSARIIRLNAQAGSRVVEVDTSLDTYQLYWADADGVIDPAVPPMTPGESF
ncbi:MAG: hypothetical protein LUD74_05420, partial [Tannerellaceae bacterium]|nr:hypothetical protein [Tannerellaceae bacterium]